MIDRALHTRECGAELIRPARQFVRGVPQNAGEQPVASVRIREPFAQLRERTTADTIRFEYRRARLVSDREGHRASRRRAIGQRHKGGDCVGHGRAQIRLGKRPIVNGQIQLFHQVSGMPPDHEANRILYVHLGELGAIHLATSSTNYGPRPIGRGAVSNVIPSGLSCWPSFYSSNRAPPALTEGFRSPCENIHSPRAALHPACSPLSDRLRVIPLNVGAARRRKRRTRRNRRQVRRGAAAASPATVR